MKRGVTSLGATMEKVGPEILYITMVDMLELLPSCSCAEGAPLRSVSSVGGENTREHSPEDSKRKPPAQRTRRRKQKIQLLDWKLKSLCIGRDGKRQKGKKKLM